MTNPLRVLCLLLISAAALPAGVSAQALSSATAHAEGPAPATLAASAASAAMPASAALPASAPGTTAESRDPAVLLGGGGPTAPPAAPTAPAEPQRIEAAPSNTVGALVQAPQEPERGDLWQRIRNGFMLPDLQGDRVRSWERYYAGKPDYVQRMTTRGARYLFHIVEEVEKRGMPLELALLPFAESAFNPQAMSSAKASGMWQFMPATGKDFSLRQNLFRDDRRDVLASTRAALDYLQRLHKLMGGDWHLALAAYNWGQGNVLRAVAVNRSQGKSTSFEALALPDETRNYVPKLQAIKNYVMAPQALGMQLPALENHPYFRSVSIDRDIDVTKAAALAGLTLEEFQALNPQMNKPVILAAATPQVLLPYDNASQFEQALRGSRLSLATWTAWVAPRTLKPAEAARHVGMSEEQLREVNRIPERMLVKAGSTLLVPRSSQVEKDVTPHLADNATIMLTPEARPMRRVTFKAGRKGESVASVARRHGVSPAALAGWNKVAATAQFKPGQPVVVLLPDVPGRGAPAKAALAASANPPEVAKTAAGRKAVALPASLAKSKTAARSKKAITVAAKREVPAKPRAKGAAKGRAASGRA